MKCASMSQQQSRAAQFIQCIKRRIDITMKMTVKFQVLLAAVFASGCKVEKKAIDPLPLPPRIEGNKIVFAANSPQLEYLTIEPADERKAAAVGLYGRLTWDDDVTVRVFSPVGGRVGSLQV